MHGTLDGVVYRYFAHTVPGPRFQMYRNSESSSGFMRDATRQSIRPDRDLTNDIIIESSFEFLSQQCASL